MGAAQPKASPELIAERQRRNFAEDQLGKLAGSEEEKLKDFGAINGANGKTRATAEQIEARVQAKRKQLAAALPADAADLAIKDATTGRVMRRARTGSGKSALGQFDVSKPLGPNSILGGE
ncbi:MAG: hypothetical protein Q8K32_09375 [Archangium sp.]|nr:hypothetical protein [Archangium sp.]